MFYRSNIYRNWFLFPDVYSCFYIPKVPGGYTEWSDWSGCTATCGGGEMTRTRNCTNPVPEHDGPTCIDQGLGPARKTANCNEKSCPSK